MTRIAYKFLAAGAVGRFSDFHWPVGSWVESHAPAQPCVAGIHACRRHELLDWLDDELWEIELDGQIEETPDLLLAERGRLTDRVEGWSETTARALADYCARRAQELGARALARAGMGDAAVSLAAADDLLDLHARALIWSESSEGATATTVAFAADAASLARGRRPDVADLGVALDQPAPEQTPAATAANLAHVVAHVAATDYAVEREDPQAYDDGFAAERALQLAWLLEILRL